jgi:hypothetical protein
MGDLYYGATRTRIYLDDRMLAHLRVVITTKLRRSEAFLLSWRDSKDIGDGRSSVWVHPHCDLHYKFSGATPADLDRELIERMSMAAGSSHGLELDEATLTSR